MHRADSSVLACRTVCSGADSAVFWPLVRASVGVCSLRSCWCLARQCQPCSRIKSETVFLSFGFCLCECLSQPENVLLDADGHVRLTDYGFAKKLQSPRDPEEARTKTPAGSARSTSAATAPGPEAGAPPSSAAAAAANTTSIAAITTPATDFPAEAAILTTSDPVSADPGEATFFRQALELAPGAADPELTILVIIECAGVSFGAGS